MKSKYNRRQFLRTVGMGTAALTFPHIRCGTRERDKKPNIIFIMADDMGYGVPGCYGGTAISTPNIDHMAEEGIRFTQAYAGCSVCAPSRSALMLGQHTGTVSVRGNTGGISILQEDVTIAEVLKKMGYTTGCFGKWGLGDFGTPGVPERHGFDVFFGYYHQIHAHFYYTDYLWHNGKRVIVANREGDPQSYTHYRIVNEMKQFIRENKDRPFFCFGSWTLPHADDSGNFVIPESDPAYLLYKDKLWDENIKGYAAMNTRLDHDLGVILNLLKDLGIDEKTIVFFCSDNGAPEEVNKDFNPSGELRGFKRSMYEGGLRVPMVVRWPKKIKPNTVTHLPCYFPDIMPTLAELSGAAPFLPENINGISLIPTLLNKDIQEKHDALYWELPNYDWTNLVYPDDWLMQAVRMGDWKLVRHNLKEPWELYNLTKDVGEIHDVSDRHPDIVAKMINWIRQNRTEPIPQIEPKMPEGKWYW